MELNQDIPRMGYIMCVRKLEKADFFGRAIYNTQKKFGLSEIASQYVHVEVLTGGYNSIRVAPPTTQIIDDFTKFYKGKYICIRRLKNDEYENKLRYKIATWAASHCNLKYDWFGIGHFLFGKWLTGSKIKYFCSENTIWAIRKELPNVMNGINTDMVMPGHFIDSNEFETVWEGQL